MAKIITVHRSKTLKLTNALLLELSKKEDFEQLENFERLIDQMDVHIRQHGAQPVGPLIQKTSMKVDENGEPQMVITFVRQADTFIHHVDPPYKMESVIKVADCLYTRFTGEEDDMQFAYNKLQLVGYEEEIPLSSETYTVFVDNDEENGTLTADIFVPKSV
ncbi:MAG: hypothetical protein LBL36_03015 [Clostridiales Family XIII bacterium]|jgi:hypothetical protein|nr:hypothetical protein [Clostridiales Family XIII bacterium]